MHTNSNQSAKGGFRQDINGLRAWAVVAVVLYHFSVPGFTGGFVGVDVFFVISGYLMTRIIVQGLSEGSFSIWQFYLARARRIIPALAVLAVVLLVLGWFTLASPDYRMLGKHVAASLTFMSNMVFWREAGYFDSTSKEKWLLHTWSLSVEWQFYLMLPLALLGAWKLWPCRTRITVLVALGFLVSLVLSIVVSPSDPSAAFYLLPTRAWEMLAGGLVYLLANRFTLGSRAKLLERLGLGLIVASVLLFDEGANWPGWRALLPVAGAVLVLLAAQSDSPWTTSRMAKWLGNASYSIYLWHWPVVVALVYLGLEGKPTAIASGLVLTLALGFLSYSLVEIPTRRHLAQLRMSLGMIGFAAATMSVAAPGVGIRLNDGFQFRMPQTVESVAQEANNKNPRRGECMAWRGATSPACIYGGKELGAVVIGDSHADSIVTAVSKALPSDASGVMELSYIGCPTILGLKRHPNHPANNEYQCGAFNKWAQNKLEGIPSRVPLIIMNRTSSYALGLNDPGTPPEQQKTPMYYFSRTYATAEPEFLHEFAKHLIETACALAKKRDVYLVRPIPEMETDVPATMSRAMMLGKEPKVSISLDAYHARHSFVWAAQDEANRRCGVKILDPLPYLCKNGQCDGARNGKPLYFDDDHLSEYGNRLLTPMFDGVLAGPLNKTEAAPNN